MLEKEVIGRKAFTNLVARNLGLPLTNSTFPRSRPQFIPTTNRATEGISTASNKNGRRFPWANTEVIFGRVASDSLTSVYPLRMDAKIDAE